jgi:hypothetical protein
MSTQPTKTNKPTKVITLSKKKTVINDTLNESNSTVEDLTVPKKSHRQKATCGKCDDLKEQNSLLEAKCDELELIIKENDDRQEELESAISENQKEISSLTKQNNKLEETLINLQDAIDQNQIEKLLSHAKTVLEVFGTSSLLETLLITTAATLHGSTETAEKRITPRVCLSLKYPLVFVDRELKDASTVSMKNKKKTASHVFREIVNYQFPDPNFWLNKNGKQILEDNDRRDFISATIGKVYF